MGRKHHKRNIIMKTALCAIFMVVMYGLTAAPFIAAENQSDSSITWRGERLALVVNDDCSFTVVDSELKRTWQFKGIEGAKIQEKEVMEKGCKARVVINDVEYVISYSASDKEEYITIAIDGDATESFTDFKYPYCSSDKDHLVLTCTEGLLIPPGDMTLARLGYPVTAENNIFHGWGVSMPFLGLTDFKSGLMMLVEDPYDAKLSVEQTETGFVIGPVWLPSMGKLSYARRLRLVFPNEGGYVPMAKYYRNYLKEKGEWCGLEEKVKENPKVAGLRGAADIWLQGEMDWEDIVVQKMKVDESNMSKLDLFAPLDYVKQNVAPAKAMISFEFHTVPLFHYDKKKAVVAEALKDGYMPGRYICPMDILPVGQFPIEELSRIAPEKSFHTGYPEDVVKNADGTYPPGFAFGDIRGSRRCATVQVETTKEEIAILKEQGNYDAIFYDVIGTVAPMECYSEKHPLTREGDVQARKKALQALRDAGYLVGTEDGTAWSCPVVHYFEGMGSLGKIRVPGASVGGGQYKTTPLFEGVQLSEKYRIPLFQLVFHDSVFSTSRWDRGTPDRFENPDMWKKHDLFIMLYGYVPIFVEDINTLKQRASGMKASLDKILPWTEKIGMDELVEHKRLTGDGAVQLSMFASGNGIVANFSPDKPVKLNTGETVEPYSYVTFDWKKHPDIAVAK